MTRKSRPAPARLEGEVPLFDEAGEPIDIEGARYSPHSSDRPKET